MKPSSALLIRCNLILDRKDLLFRKSICETKLPNYISCLRIIAKLQLYLHHKVLIAFRKIDNHFRRNQTLLLFTKLTNLKTFCLTYQHSLKINFNSLKLSELMLPTVQYCNKKSKRLKIELQLYIVFRLVIDY